MIVKKYTPNQAGMYMGWAILTKMNTIFQQTEIEQNAEFKNLPVLAASIETGRCIEYPVFMSS